MEGTHHVHLKLEKNEEQICVYMDQWDPGVQEKSSDSSVWHRGNAKKLHWPCRIDNS